MRKLTFAGVLVVCLTSCLFANAAPPAPAGTGVAKDDGAADQSSEKKPAETKTPADADKTDALIKQVTDLETEIKSLRLALDKIGDPQNELVDLKGEVAILKGDNAGLTESLKTLKSDSDKLSERLKFLEGDTASLVESVDAIAKKMETEGPKERTTAKPAFVKSAVRFYNHEGRAIKMNVNGVWHTIKEGENTIWVPYAPVHVYRYTGAEPRTFWKWQAYMDGYVLEFDVGAAPKK